MPITPKKKKNKTTGTIKQTWAKSANRPPAAAGRPKRETHPRGEKRGYKSEGEYRPTSYNLRGRPPSNPNLSRHKRPARPVAKPRTPPKKSSTSGLSYLGLRKRTVKSNVKKGK
jgi:hypothetical protein